jgi:hypothetical protein
MRHRCQLLATASVDAELQRQVQLSRCLVAAQVPLGHHQLVAPPLRHEDSIADLVDRDPLPTVQVFVDVPAQPEVLGQLDCGREGPVVETNVHQRNGVSCAYWFVPGTGLAIRVPRDEAGSTVAREHIVSGKRPNS